MAISAPWTRVGGGGHVDGSVDRDMPVYASSIETAGRPIGPPKSFSAQYDPKFAPPDCYLIARTFGRATAHDAVNSNCLPVENVPMTMSAFAGFTSGVGSEADVVHRLC